MNNNIFENYKYRLSQEKSAELGKLLGDFFRLEFGTGIHSFKCYPENNGYIAEIEVIKGGGNNGIYK